MLILVRHGETALNAARVLQPADTPLSDRGLRQAERLAERLARLGVAHVLCSDLLRARMTAGAAIRATGAPADYSALLAERNFGDLRGTPYTELTADVFARGYEPPGGESEAAFDERVDRAWRYILAGLASTPGNLLVVTHGLVCRSLVGRFLKMPVGREPPVRFGNASVTLVGRVPPYAVELLDCVAHLSGDAADDRGTAPA